MANPNLRLLIAMAQALGPMRGQMVFVGGCATGLLVDDTNLMDVRPTEDVDVSTVTNPDGLWRCGDQDS